MQVNCLDAPFTKSKLQTSQKQKRLSSPRNAENHRHNPKIDFQSPQISTHIRRDRDNTNKKSKEKAFRSHHTNRCNFTQFCAIFSYSPQFLNKHRKAQFTKSNLRNLLNTDTRDLHKNYVNPANTKIDCKNTTTQTITQRRRNKREKTKKLT